MKKFFIHTMGCKSNQFESSIIEENLENNGLKKVNDIKNANIYILNSCSVTHKSDNEALYLLRAAKHKNSKIVTILTGCIAQIEKEKLLKYDFIDYVIGNDEKLHLYKYLSEHEHFCANDDDLTSDLDKERKDFTRLYEWLVGNEHPLTNWFYGHFHTSAEIYDETMKIRFCLLNINELSRLK